MRHNSDVITLIHVTIDNATVTGFKISDVITLIRVTIDNVTVAGVTICDIIIHVTIDNARVLGVTISDVTQLQLRKLRANAFIEYLIEICSLFIGVN